MNTIETEILYYDGILQTYSIIIDLMNKSEINALSLRFKYMQLFGYMNNCLDYVAHERSEQVANKLDATNTRNLARDLRQMLTNSENNISPLSYVRDIANVSKHVKISRNDKVIGNISQIDEAIYTIKYRDEIGEYISYKFGVIVHSDDSSQYNHCEIIAYNAIKDIRGLLVEFGILKEGEGQKFEKPRYHTSRHEASYKSNPTINVLTGRKDKTVCAIKGYVYDEDYPLKIRLPSNDEKPFNIQLPIIINVKENIYE